MMIGVTYKDGVLVPDAPLRLKSRHLTVAIPDDACAGDEDSHPSGLDVVGTIRRQIDEILGPYAGPSPAVAPDADKRLWRQHLEQKHS